MMLTEATRENLRRKSAYIDHVQMHGNIPLFSWVDLNITELCNRTCIFCPRADNGFYPNQPLHMSLNLAWKIGSELQSLNYEGVVVLCGFGEPLLHPDLPSIIRALKPARVEIVTNGDKLTVDVIKELVDSGADYFVVSMYDGPHQIDAFRRKFADAGQSEELYILRDRWHTEEDGFGLKLTNRAGTVTVGHQEPVDVTHACHYLTYQMTVDWNGDVLLCVQDWHKKIKFGNLTSDDMLAVWTSTPMCKRRIQLMNGKRTATPCNGCNAEGTLHGFNHVPAWRGGKS